MNKNYGFTLIELLAVLLILAVITILVFPAITTVLKQSENTIYDTQINRILNSAYDYSLKNINLLPEYENIKYITLGELKKNGFIDNNIQDPNANELFPDNLVISIKNVGSSYKNKSSNSKVKGHFLYKVEIDFMNSDEFLNNEPEISFNGYGVTPIVLTINIGDEYNPLSYSAISSTGMNLTDKVIENITYNSNIVNKIDTSRVGIYYIHYSIVDQNGYSNSSTVSVIVNDDEAPSLILPDNETISLNDYSYNLMEDVSCSDNSGECEISVSGKINFGISGKNVIEYKAFDPSGNTTILKRVITVR